MMKYVLALTIFSSVQAHAVELPPNAIKYLPAVTTQAKSYWPEFPPKYLAGQIEQESCISLKHKKCWNPRAELKTSREVGFGVGQITIAYNADGSERFNVFKELKKQDSVLSNWKYEDRYNPDYQIRALMVKDKMEFNRIKWDAPSVEKYAFMFAAYNGGGGAITQDRKLCTVEKKCNNKLWFNNVELYSFKSKIKVKGYGKSFFEINREYPKLIIFERSAKYEDWLRKQGDASVDDIESPK